MAQYVLKLRNLLVNAHLATQFEGPYVTLSTQKFGSNLVEKCLQIFDEQIRAKDHTRVAVGTSV